MLCIMDAAIGLVGIQRLPAVGLGERFGGAHATRCGVEELARLVQSLVVTDVPVVEPLFSVVVERGVHLQVEVASATQLTKDGGDAAGTVDVLDVVGAVRRDLGQARYAVGDLVDVLQSEVHLALLCCGQGVEDGVGGPAHRHVQCHGVAKGFLRCDGARQHGIVLFAVVTATHVDDGGACLCEKLLARGVGCQSGPVSGQCQT